MSLWEKGASLFERAEQKEPVEWMVWGSLSLLSTLTLVSYPKIRLGILFLAVLGLVLSARYRMRGAAYSLMLLGISSAIHHCLAKGHHFWILGLEISMGLAFFVIGLSAEQIESKRITEEERAKAMARAAQNLEQDLQAERDASFLQEIRSKERIEALLKECEEVESDKSSLLILNDVLRKAAAQRLHEKESTQEERLFLSAQVVQLKLEKKSLEEQLKRLLDEEGLARQNHTLFEEINQIRAEKLQTQLINETLVKLHAKEVLRAQEVQLEASALKSQAQEQMQQAQALCERVEEEKGQITQRLLAAEKELAAAKEKPDVDIEELNTLREAVKKLNRTEALYHQLRQQFDEKGQILHQTRQELFAVTTKLEALQIEKEHEEPFFQEAAYEWDLLEEENRQLQELVTYLSVKEEEKPLKRKRKTKVLVQQQQLF